MERDRRVTVRGAGTRAVALALLATLAIAAAPTRTRADAVSRPDTYGRAAKLIRNEIERVERSRAGGDAIDVAQRAVRLWRLASDIQALAESLAVVGLLPDTALASVHVAGARLETAAAALGAAANAGDTATVAIEAARCAAAYATLHAYVPEQYVCPMRCEPGKVYAAPGVCPVCRMDLQLVTDDRWRVEVTPLGGKPRAGSLTTLRIRIQDPAGFDGRRLLIVHEKPIHLMVVSEDLSWFAHVHPESTSDGTFSLPITFPAGGTYTLFHDFTPERVGLQVVPVDVTVEGKRRKPVALAVDDTLERVDGYDVRLRHTVLAIDADCAMSFTITQNGKPVTDLEPFLGASGHLVMIRQDRGAYVHSHPLEDAGEYRSGPTVRFNMRFERTGLYRAWGQFQRRGRVITVPFTVEVTTPRR